MSFTGRLSLAVLITAQTVSIKLLADDTDDKINKMQKQIEELNRLQATF